MSKINWVFTLLGVIGGLLIFLDKFVFSENYKKNFTKRFELWWSIVNKYSAAEFALTIARNVEHFINYIFGVKLISKKSLVRSFLISLALLLAVIVLKITHDKINVWHEITQSYTDSVDQMAIISDYMSSYTNTAIFKTYTFENFKDDIEKYTNSAVVDFDGKRFFVTLQTNAMTRLKQLPNIGEGNLVVYYSRYHKLGGNVLQKDTNIAGVVTQSLDPLDERIKSCAALNDVLKKHRQNNYKNYFGIAVLVGIFIMNWLLFLWSLFFGRILIREMAITHRIISQMALGTVNALGVVIGAGIILIVFALVFVPFMWILVPASFVMGSESFTLLVSLSATSISLSWLVGVISCIPIAILASIPSILVLFIGVATVGIIINRQVFHNIVMFLLSLFTKNGAYSFLGAFLAVVGLVGPALLKLFGCI